MHSGEPKLPTRSAVVSFGCYYFTVKVTFITGVSNYYSWRATLEIRNIFVGHQLNL